MSANATNLYSELLYASQMVDVNKSSFSNKREDETSFVHQWNTIVQNNESLSSRLQNHFIKLSERYSTIFQLYEMNAKLQNSSYKPYTNNIEKYLYGGYFDSTSEDTDDFINTHNLLDSIKWLQSVAPDFFPGANFKIDLLPAEEDNNNIISLKVYGSFKADEFRENRNRLSQAMLAANHNKLYDMISIFQRRIQSSGWQAFSALITSVA